MSPHIPACVSLRVNNVKASRALRWSSISLKTQRCQGSGGQGLCHAQSLQRPPHSYLEHVCHTHSYAFAPLHPCLYLAVPLQRPGPKDTDTKACQHCQDVHVDTLNLRDVNPAIHTGCLRYAGCVEKIIISTVWSQRSVTVCFWGLKWWHRWSDRCCTPKYNSDLMPLRKVCPFPSSQVTVTTHMKLRTIAHRVGIWIACRKILAARSRLFLHLSVWLSVEKQHQIIRVQMDGRKIRKFTLILITLMASCLHSTYKHKAGNFLA